MTSCVFEAPEGEAEATADAGQGRDGSGLRPRAELSVPLVVETGAAHNWDEAH